MKVCVVGSGGREHALASVLARDADVIVTPGNPAMTRASGLDGSGAITVTDLPVEQIEADLYVIGPEAPLVDGLADRLRDAGRLVFGPGAEGARLEGSKAYMKQLLVDAGVPTAKHRAFTAADPAIAFLHELQPPYVVKTDGLAAGKGVLVTDDLAEAEADVRAKLSGESFGDAGRQIVIEEGMVGTELSILAICDGTRAVALAPAQDFKRVGDGDVGPNTGGVGAYSPVAAATPALVDEIMATIIIPTVSALRLRGIDYRGVLYAGLMLTPDGPRVLEFNVRFGDPECQALMVMWEEDVVPWLLGAANGALPAGRPAFRDGAACCVVLAAANYPETPEKGAPIPEGPVPEGVVVFQAGTVRGADGVLRTNGGRVLGVTAVGENARAAQDAAYGAVPGWRFAGAQLRGDIGGARG